MAPLSKASPPLRADVLEAASSFDAIEADWHRLALDAPKATCFMLPSYFHAWHRTLADDVETRLVAVRRGDELCGVLPVMRGLVWRGPSCVPRIDYAPADRPLSPGRAPRPLPVRQLSSVVSWPATSLRPTLLARPQDEVAVANAVAAAMAEMPKWDAIVLPVYEGEEESRWLAAFRDTGLRPWVHRLGRVVVTLERVRPTDAIIAEQNRKYRQNVRRAKAAADSLGVTFGILEGRAEVCNQLEIIARIAKASWKQTGRDGAQIAVAYEGRQRRFFETLLRRDAADLTPTLAVASCDGDPIAVLLSLRHAMTLTLMLLFWDERCPAASPGHLLMLQMIDWAAGRKLDRVDLNSTQPWTRHFADERRTLANLVAFAPTAIGRTYGWISRAAQRRHAQPAKE